MKRTTRPRLKESLAIKMGAQAAKRPSGKRTRPAMYGALTGVSLFTGGGIGDLALRACGVEVVVASELLSDRAEVYRANYPETHMIVGDIRTTKRDLLKLAQKRLDGRTLDVLFATPPCQGMSRNGRGKLLNGIRSGIKPKFDERNGLALEAVEIALKLDPKLIVFENVPEMEFTLVERSDGSVGGLLETIAERLAPRYSGRWEVVEFADYGVPQRRQRLITIFSRVEPSKQLAQRGASLLPPRTHSSSATIFTKPWITVDDVLSEIPSLDATSKKSAEHPSLPFHRVPVLDQDKYFWVSNTPPGKGAFDNQCANPKCRFDGNPTHSSKHDLHGINRASKETPVRCLRCGELLPRPWVVEGGTHRLMSGFTSAYKRMRGDLPASALTRNLSYACSDQKLHPREHRVLSLHEALLLHTVSDYHFDWRRADQKQVSDKTIREIIGESIPPRGLQRIFAYVLELQGLAHSESRARGARSTSVKRSGGSRMRKAAAGTN
ncbi:MAG: DNA cytosine methyltransferase [Candidatus Eisenbacteria bacterium]|uniref:DNA (cytosine-5-)-methyltransferase n=1 Tax=Eiseniibacteriota bacterium TaxID=2212470 RepID=A0A933WBP2_UNCEI|nr:DNA cytosine methyltransferase [Candidatus Eisenbacteria bacterium]